MLGRWVSTSNKHWKCLQEYRQNVLISLGRQTCRTCFWVAPSSHWVFTVFHFPYVKGTLPYFYVFVCGFFNSFVNRTLWISSSILHIFQHHFSSFIYRIIIVFCGVYFSHSSNRIYVYECFVMCIVCGNIFGDGNRINKDLQRSREYDPEVQKNRRNAEELLK